MDHHRCNHFFYTYTKTDTNTVTENLCSAVTYFSTLNNNHRSLPYLLDEGHKSGTCIYSQLSKATHKLEFAPNGVRGFPQPCIARKKLPVRMLSPCSHSIGKHVLSATDKEQYFLYISSWDDHALWKA